MKKTAAFLLTLVLTLGVFSGCNSPSTAPTPAEEPTTPAPVPAEEPAAPVPETPEQTEDPAPEPAEESKREPQSWNLYAAGGLKPALDVVAARFMEETGDEITLNYSPAGTLYNQIIEGQPCDLYYTADWIYVEQLEEQGLTESSAKLLNDSMVLVVSESAKDKITCFEDLTKDGVTFAICDSNAPIGVYAETGLKSMGLWEEAEKNLVARPAGHAQLVLMVTEDEIDATILFSSVANTSELEAVDVMDQSDSGEVIFGTATIAGGNTAAANEFVEFLRAHPEEFIKYGWIPYEG